MNIRFSCISLEGHYCLVWCLDESFVRWWFITIDTYKIWHDAMTNRLSCSIRSQRGQLVQTYDSRRHTYATLYSEARPWYDDILWEAGNGITDAPVYLCHNRTNIDLLLTLLDIVLSAKWNCDRETPQLILNDICSWKSYPSKHMLLL